MVLEIVSVAVLTTLCSSLNLSATVCGGEACVGVVASAVDFEFAKFFALEMIGTVYNDTWQPCDEGYGLNNETIISCDTEGGEASLTDQLCSDSATPSTPPTPLPVTSDDDEAVVILIVVFVVIAILVIIVYLLCKASAKGPKPRLNDVTFQQVIQADREARPQLHKYYAGADKENPATSEPLLDTVVGNNGDYDL
eukprot:TRINITY_DN6940_c1_g1_i1.p1 TRINITY_DN6940_c1_g1~~TRINITY_DN6940_c1_g1_i1.p1  ORF type:complete len:196 (+),score=34.79 TRINITY_DN6940_c1_g1_i1:104-691(+)